MTKLFFKKAVIAGLIAGAVFMMLEMIMVPMFMGGSPWGPPRMIAAILLGKSVLPMPPQPVTFDFGVMMAAMFLHFMLSIIFAIIIGWLCKNLRVGTSVLVGAVIGLILYFINFYGLTSVFPWFAMARTWVSIFSHVMFGMVAAFCFKKLFQPMTVSSLKN